MWTLQRRLHGHCVATFCPSNSTRTMLESNAFDNVRIWPRGIDMSLFSPAHRSLALRNRWLASAHPKSAPTTFEKGIVITYVGRLSSEKNIDLLINSFIKLNQALRSTQPDSPGCHLVLVGDGPARKRLEEQTKNLNVTFMGYQKGKDLAACYASSDVFAFPSHSETFGNVVLEAMASGLPVIGLKAEGVCDLVESGSTGENPTLWHRSIFRSRVAVEFIAHCRLPARPARFAWCKSPKRNLRYTLQRPTAI